MSGPEDAEFIERRHQKPHSGHDPIPTIQSYRESKHKQLQELGYEDKKGVPIPDAASEDETKSNGSVPGTARQWWHGKSNEDQHKTNGRAPEQIDIQKSNNDEHHIVSKEESKDDHFQITLDTSESQVQGTSDPKKRRKQMKHSKASRAERVVTDPVTHLPVTIHDYTGDDLREVEIEGRDDDDDGIQDDEDVDVNLSQEHKDSEPSDDLKRASRIQTRQHKELYHRFPPPRFDEAQNELVRVHKRAAITIVSFTIVVMVLILAIELLVPDKILTMQHKLQPHYVLIGEVLVAAVLISLGIRVVGSWAQKQVSAVWQDAIWHAQKIESREALRSSPQETTLWLNKLIGSIWPIVNPDLFTSLSDTLEDVMQASLPRMVRMISVDDIGQGSEPIRILGVRWLPRGAADRSIADEKKSDSIKNSNAGSKRPGGDKDPDNQDDTEATKEDRAQEGDTQEAMEAEEGEFVNVEIAFAYRASRFQKKLHERVKNAHLLLAFYLPGNVKLPVWVELHGVVGLCRLRLQLTPDPPFVALCTVTFLGQPKIDMKCVPLLRSGLNIMDLPLISNFVQSSIDAALSEYVAPKSIGLNLQEMLAGTDFKKDTTARGILTVRIKRAYGFKASDVGMPLIGKEKTSDAYVSVGWAKFGKPLWSTRIITADMQPWWEETAYLLVSPVELDAQESLRVQLWDFDKYSADDDLGRIEISLKSLMQNESSNGKIWDRIDSLKALEVRKGMPGHLEWSVGYFTKARLAKSQFEEKNNDPDVKSIEDLKQKTYDEADRKLREAAKREDGERQQLKEDDWVNTQIDMISLATPVEDFPSGILSIQVHQIVGLQMENVRENKDPEEEEDMGDHDLPDSYCTIIINDQKIFRTRTKPKNSSPFFNAGTERFIRDWRNTTVMLSVRDQRVHEDDPLLGHIYLDLGEIFRKQKTSRINSFYPLAGGIGFGRLRVSLLFRSIQMKMPSQSLGWDVGVLEVAPEAIATKGLSSDVSGQRIKLRTNLGTGRMHSTKIDTSDQTDTQVAAKWCSTHKKALLLPVRKRYASGLMLEFSKPATGILPKSNKVSAFCSVWLKDVLDESWSDLVLPIYTNHDNVKNRVAANVLPREELQCNQCGELRLRVRFWRGLGKPHGKVARRNKDIADVMEVKNAARELGNCPAMVGVKGWREEQSVGSDDEYVDDDSQSDHGSVNDEEAASTHEAPIEEEAKFKDSDHDVVNKVGEVAQDIRKKLPFTKAHENAKQDLHEQDATGAIDGNIPSSNHTNTHAEAGQQEPTSPTQEENASPDQTTEPDVPQTQPSTSETAPAPTNNEPDTTSETTTPSALTRHPTTTSTTSRPSPPSRTPSAPGTPTHSRPTTASTTTNSTPHPTSTPRSKDKRASGVFGNIRRSLSLRSSPVSGKQQKEKRGSRVFSDNFSRRSTDAGEGEQGEGGGEAHNASREQLHRRHRGIMQLKGARTAKWMAGKAEAGAVEASERIRGHGEREPGVETEV